MKKTKELIPAESSSAESLISKAIDKNVPVETMERLLAMRRELKAEFSKEEYNRAMSEFQAKCPIIKKTKIVKNKDGTVRYKFAPIESIVLQVQSLLERHGFSYSINTKTDGELKVFCKVTHEKGHSEVSEFSVPIDKDAFMNAAQKVASASTFAKRYAFCNAFGILTGDEDDDSVSYQPTKPVAMIDKKQITRIGELLEIVKMPLDKLEKQIGKPIQELTAKGAREVIDQLVKAAEKKEAKTGEVIVVCEACGNSLKSAEVDVCDNSDETIEVAGKRVKYICDGCRKEITGEKDE